MTTRRSILFVLLGLLISLPLTAQRGRSTGRPTSRPSTSRPAPSRPAPRATPRVSRPAPRASRPAPTRQAPRTTRTPSPSRPTSRPAPRTTSRPTYRAPTRTTTRPTSRPTTRPTSRSTYRPPSRTTTPSRTTSRPSTSRPTTSRPTTSRPSNTRTTPSRSYTPRSSSSAGRYRPTRPTDATGTRTPRDVSTGRTINRTVRTPATTARPQPSRSSTTRAPSRATSSSSRPTAGRSSAGIRRDTRGATKQPSDTARYRSRASKPAVTRTKPDVRASRPRKAPRPISQRYRPSDVVNATTPRPSAGTLGRLKPRTPAPVVSSGALGRSPSVTPSLGSPRLGSPRTSSPRSSRSFVGYTSARPGYGYNYGYGNVWGCGWGWNNSWCFNSWGVGASWGYSPFGCGWATRWGLGSWGCGFNPWCWNVGVLAPYYAWHCNYWNSCYQSTYWNNWSVPNALPASYWWYPSTTYCPTYLYVPSSVAVVEETAAAPVDGGSTEVIVAGSDVVGSARVSDGAVGDPLVAVGAAKSEAMKLAEEYVKLGDFHFQAERFDDAAEAYAKARNYMPEDASVHLVLADAVFANGDYHYAAFLIAEAVRLEPGIVTAETDKRDFYGDPKTFDAQMDALQRYCKEKPYDAWAQLLLACNLRFSDRSARAIVAFQRVLELDRDNPTARAFLAELNKPAPAVAPEAGR